MADHTITLPDPAETRLTRIARRLLGGDPSPAEVQAKKTALLETAATRWVNREWRTNRNEDRASLTDDQVQAVIDGA